MQKQDLSGLLDKVIALVETAGERLIAEWQRDGGPRGMDDKAEIDEELEVFFQEELPELLEADFWGEETLPHLSGNPYCWVVDPHDGTRDFLYGLPGSSISVALLYHQVPVLGVVYAPISPDRGKDCIAWAEGLPYLLRNREPLKVNLSKRELGRDSIIFLSAAAAKKPYVNAELCEPARFIAMPSIAYRLARAAAGDGICGVSLVGLSAHDVAGGHALLRGAGGVLVDQQGYEVNYQDMERVSVHCFGGAPDACAELLQRPWNQVYSTPTTSPRHPIGSPTFPRLTMMQRAQGCLAGLLAGDNLGAQVEFMSAARIALRCETQPLIMEDGGAWNIQAGQPTDDGELALALARSLVSSGTYNVEAAAKAYVEWVHSSPFDVGNTIRQALLGPLRHPDLSVAEACRLAASPNSQANGALMRVAPIGIAAYGRPDLAAAWARQDALLTHPHPVCLEANAAYAAAIAAGVQGYTRKEMFEAAMDVLDHSPSAEIVKECLLSAEDGYMPEDYMEHMGWVLIALQNAFCHLMAGHGVEKAVVESALQGGDTDTNACITGALIGATDGIKGINKNWLLHLQACRPYKESLSPRPLRYWPDDVLQLSKYLLDMNMLN